MDAAAGEGDLARLPHPRHWRVRLEGLQALDPPGRLAAVRQAPQAVDPPFLVSWNNKQAPKWAAADDKYSYGPLFRSQMIEDKVTAATKGKKKMTIVQLIQAMEEPATQDLRGYRLLPTIFKAIGEPKLKSLRQAFVTLRTWHEHGAHRRDLDRDGVDEENDAV